MKTVYQIRNVNLRYIMRIIAKILVAKNPKILTVLQKISYVFELEKTI